ncbi:MAG: hypothetical protein KatS3mg043_1443 [Rhodothermaceae bacterium]|nr:MAG: hypothetical protein KatS3mg043_1443 [Rhodothermaceae bacterium]
MQAGFAAGDRNHVDVCSGPEGMMKTRISLLLAGVLLLSGCDIFDPKEETAPPVIKDPNEKPEPPPTEEKERILAFKSLAPTLPREDITLPAGKGYFWRARVSPAVPEEEIASVEWFNQSGERIGEGIETFIESLSDTDSVLAVVTSTKGERQTIRYNTRMSTEPFLVYSDFIGDLQNPEYIQFWQIPFSSIVSGKPDYQKISTVKGEAFWHSEVRGDLIAALGEEEILNCPNQNQGFWPFALYSINFDKKIFPAGLECEWIEIRSVDISPDGRYITFIATPADEPDVRALYKKDLQTGEISLLWKPKCAKNDLNDPFPCAKDVDTAVFDPHDPEVLYLSYTELNTFTWEDMRIRIIAISSQTGEKVGDILRIPEIIAKDGSPIRTLYIRSVSSTKIVGYTIVGSWWIVDKDGQNFYYHKPNDSDFPAHIHYQGRDYVSVIRPIVSHLMLYEINSSNEPTLIFNFVGRRTIYPQLFHPFLTEGYPNIATAF